MLIELIQRGIVHRSQQFGISRTTIGIKHAQFPFFLLTGTELIAERIPLQLQFLVRLRFGNLCIVRIKLSVFHKSDTYHYPISILLLVSKRETDNGIGELHASAFHPLIAGKDIIKKIDALFTAANIDSSRRISFKFLSVLIEPISGGYRRPFVVEREQQKVLGCRTFSALRILSRNPQDIRAGRKSVQCFGQKLFIGCGRSLQHLLTDFIIPVIGFKHLINNLRVYRFSR